MQHEGIGIGAELGDDKGNPLCHQAGDEGDVARQPVEPRYYDGEFVLARSSERGCKLWPPFHHLSSRIPYYRLPEALRDHPELRNVGRLTLFESLKAVRLVLLDEEQRRLISFAEAHLRLTATMPFDISTCRS